MVSPLRFVGACYANVYYPVTVSSFREVHCLGSAVLFCRHHYYYYCCSFTRISKNNLLKDTNLSPTSRL